MRRLGFICAVSAAAALLAPTLASAHTRPPNAELEVNGQTQKVGAWTYDWQYAAGGGRCAGINSDGIPGERRALTVDTLHSRPRIVFRRPQVPSVKSFIVSSKRDRGGFPAGRQRNVSSALRPVRRRGEIVAWKLRWRARVPAARFYDLTVDFAPYPGRKCGNEGSGSYAFGLERE